MVVSCVVSVETDPRNSDNKLVNQVRMRPIKGEFEAVKIDIAESQKGELFGDGIRDVSGFIPSGNAHRT